jgi:hypothetical protein
MAAMRAHVRNGRVVLDEPVDLPEGTTLEVDLRPAEMDDGIPPEERKQVLRAIDDGLAAARRGEHVDAEAFVNELLAEP